METVGLKCMLLLLFSMVRVDGILFNETQAVHQTLASFYSNNNKSLTSIIPLSDLSKPITVQITLCLYSLDGFDALTGQVEISASLYMEWTDETWAADIGNYGFSDIPIGYSVMISPDLIWTPSLVLLNAADGVKNVGDASYKVRYLVEDGRSKWQPRAVVKASCRPNVKYYPFDRQDCSFTYTAWGYTKDEVVLEKAQSDWYMCDFTANAKWSLISTSAEEYIKNDQYYVSFRFTIERAPMFFVLNIIFPIILLAFLDGFVFMLPVDSGERIGFCVTCALSFMFLLQSVLNVLPQTAEPMSMICFYVVVMMMASMAQCVFTVLVLRVYHKPAGSKVPKSVQTIVTVVSFAWVIPIFNRCKKVCKKRTGHKDDEPNLENINSLYPGEIHGAVSIDAATGGIEMDTVIDTKIPEVKYPLSLRKGPSTRVRIGGFPKSLRRPPVIPVPSSVEKSAALQIKVNAIDTKANIGDSDPVEAPLVMSTLSKESSSSDMESEDSTEIKEVKWVDVGKSLDVLLFFAFTGFQTVFTLLYIIPLSSSGA